MKAPKGAVAVIAGFALVIGFLCYTVINHSAHVLYQLPEWVSAKSLIPNGLISAQEFFLERQTLAHDRLNLASWNGPNEVHWNVARGWDRLELDVSLAPNAYVWIFFRQTENRRLAFRLSRNEKYKSGFFELNSGKEFVLKEFFELPAAKDEFQKVIVLSGINGTSLQVGADVLFRKNIDPAIPQLLSFRSSLNQVVLDNLKLTGSGYALFENFSPRLNLRHLVLAVAITLTILLLAFLKRTLFQGTSLLVLVALLGFVAVGADRYVWAPSYYYKGFAGYGVTTITDLRLDFENVRRNLFFILFSAVGDSRSAFVLSEKNYLSRFFIPENTGQLSETAKKIYYPNGLEENTSAIRRQYIAETGKVEFLEHLSDLAEKISAKKIAFLGSSQTFGGGAQSMNRSFPALVVAALNLCSKAGVTGYNFSAPGENSAQLLQSYRELLKIWQPELLLVNLSHNDKDPAEFRKNIAALLQLNSSLKIRTVLVKEPNSPELEVQHLTEKYQILKELAQQFRVPLVDLPEYLATEGFYDSGLLWWDIVHFDQAGHNAAADWLSATLKLPEFGICP